MLLVERFLDIENSERSVAEALGGTNDRHPYIGRRVNNRQSRSICGNHLKRTIYVSFVKDLFEDLSEYISSTMRNAALKGLDPARFVGDAKIDITAAEFLASGSWSAAVGLVSDTVFRKIENEKSTKDLVRKASARLGLQLDQTKFDVAMPYLEARHVLVHRDGKVDDRYRQEYPRIRIKDEKIVVDHMFVTDARSAVTELALDIDRKVIAANLVRLQDMSGLAAAGG
ncbi:hypothetical protein [Inquilinus sp. CA228]|uniref:hypothetical protein n=1 Tax=Inquilinus sp. CA228 TaxID=3455609 RepID=UPI003F8D1542